MTSDGVKLAYNLVNFIKLVKIYPERNLAFYSLYILQKNLGSNNV